MIDKAFQTLPEFFLLAYQCLFNSGLHPQPWKEAIGIIIPKRNKKDYSVPKSYRPISLLPCLSKLLEKIFARRLSYHANLSDKLLHPSQMGGRKQRSAIDAALLLHDFVMASLKKKKIVSTVLLDIMGAFDRLQPAKLVEVLCSLSLPPVLISWVTSFLSTRSIKLLFNGQLSQAFPVQGTPQGSPVSPILFLISVRYLFPSLYSSQNKCILSYMDDISVSHSSFSVVKNIKSLHVDLDHLFGKANDLGITFEVEKTELIHFTGKKGGISTPLVLNG